MVWERAGRLAGLAGGRSGSPLAHSVGTCLHWASPGFSVGVGLIRGQKFSAASLGACNERKHCKRRFRSFAQRRPRERLPFGFLVVPLAPRSTRYES
jgi:hypothetical protein